MRFAAVFVCLGIGMLASSVLASSTRLNAALFKAAERGDFKAVQQVVARGADVGARDKTGQTPLHVAAFESDDDAARFGAILRFLIAKGADVNAKDNQKQTALMSAVLQNRLCTEILLNRGADANARTENDETALMWAAGVNGDLATIRLLLSRGAQLNARDKNGESALADAISHGKISVARFLIERGAPVNQADDDGETLLMTAARGQIDKLNLLLERGANLEARDERGRTALMHGAYDSQIVYSLVQRGAQVNARDKNGNTALMTTDNPSAAAILLKHGAQTELANRNGETAILLASKNGDSRSSGAKIRLLLEAKAHLNARDVSGQTALMHTIYGDNIRDKDAHALFTARTRFLLRHGAKVNLRDNSGKTALIIAARWNNEEIAQMLVARGADVQLGDRNGNSALDWAKTRRHAGIVRLLERSGAGRISTRRNPLQRTSKQQRILNGSLIDAAERGEMASLKRRIDQGASLEAKRSWNADNPTGETALIAAAQGELGEGNPETVRFLLEQGVKVNARGRHGQTALMVAVGGATELLSLLLRAGADVNARDNDGETALMNAAHIFTHDGATISLPKTIQTLLQHGALAGLRSKAGRTALDFTREAEFNARTFTLLRSAMRREARAKS